MSAKTLWRLRILLVLAAVFITYRLTLHFMVQAKLNAIRQQGYPVTLAELDKWYPQPPPGENAADLYVKAFQQFGERLPQDTNLPVVGFVNLPPRSERFSEAMRNDVEAYLARNARALTLLHEAAAKKDCRYPLELGQPLSLFKRVSAMRQGARLLLLEASWQADRGAAEEALQSTMAGFRLAHSADQEPLTISQLVGEACEVVNLNALSRCLSQCALSDAQLAQFAGWMREDEQSGKPSRCQRGLIGDRALDVQLLCAPSSELAQWFGSAPRQLSHFFVIKVFFYRCLGLHDLDTLGYLHYTEKFLSILQLPQPRRLQAAMMDTNRNLHPLGMVGIPRIIKELIQKEASGDGLRAAARVAIAIESYRLANQKLPDTLKDMASYLPAISTDPFDGQPLRFKKLAKGYVVYSIGKDLTDDGGDEKKDVAFSVER